MDRIKNALNTIIGPWIAANIVSLGTDAVVCGMAVSGLVGFGTACAEQSFDSLFDLIDSLLVEVATEMKNDGTMPPDEVDAVILVLKGILLATNISEVSNDLDLLFTALSFLNEEEVDNPQLKMTIKFGIDEAKKASLLIELVKK